MDPKLLVAQLHTAKGFFDKSTGALTEDDATFAPVEGTYTVAQQIAHVADTFDWFIDGAFGDGFDMNFEGREGPIRATTSLADARAKLETSFGRAVEVIGSKSADELQSALPADSILGGAPRGAIVAGMIEHTSHHRGALAVYTRLRGKVPPMPYL